MRKSILCTLFSIGVLSSSFTYGQLIKKFNVLTEATTVFKFAPTKMFSGVVDLGVEHVIGDRTSLEVSAGPTLSNVSPFGGHSILEQVNGFTSTEGSMLGFHVSAGIRFYPLEERYALNGFYVSPLVTFRQFNYNFVDLYNAQDTKTGFLQETGFGFIFGSQNWLSNHFGLDFYLGSGLKGISAKSFYSNYNPNTQESVLVERNENRASWFITGGIKVGIGFSKKN